jgi:two-component system sensor histidine kinase BaeS
MEERPHNGPPGVLLSDNQDRPIVGSSGPEDQRRLVDIEVDGQIVGWLGLQHREPLGTGPPAALLKRQARHFYFLGGVVIALTALIAFLFSRRLLNPIQRLARGTGELANRNFKIRITPTTRDELGQLADNFNAMAQTLENYERMRRQWLTDISHELRTPLAVLRGEIEALQDGIRDPSPRNLASLHAEILRIGKIVENYQARFARRRIDIDLMLSGMERVRIKGDAYRLGQVFTNILENACKYMSSPGTLKISCQTDDRFLNLYFEDTGPGVPENALPQLFDRLFRVESSRSRDSGGSGLGLSICRQIIENHDGKIWADSSTLGGLCIGISLPLQRSCHGR